MIVDDVENFLKFLDNVSFQLACLLDIDDQGRHKKLRKSCARQKLGQASKSSTSLAPKAINTSSSSCQATGCNGSGNTAATRNNNVQRSANRRSARDRKRKGRLAAAAAEMIEPEPPQVGRPDTRKQINKDETADILTQQTKDTVLVMYHGSSGDLQSQQKSHSDLKLDASLDEQLTLGIADELPSLADHGGSISPVTHLSPMDPSFGPMHQPATLHHNYYSLTPTRATSQHHNPQGIGQQQQHQHQLDSYQSLHDEFSGHESIPIAANASSHLNSEQHQQRIGDHHLLIGGSPQHGVSSLRDLDGLDATDCYPSLMHHLHQTTTTTTNHHQSHQQQLQQQDHPIVHQQQQQPFHTLHLIEQHPWLNSQGNNGDVNNTLSLNAPEPGTLDLIVIPPSPNSHHHQQQHQNSQLTHPDQVQYNSNQVYGQQQHPNQQQQHQLTSHSGYYTSHQSAPEHLDSFNQLGNDYATVNSDPLTSPQQHQQSRQQQPQQHMQLLTSPSSNSDNNYEQHNNHMQTLIVPYCNNHLNNQNLSHHHHNNNHNNHHQHHHHHHHHLELHSQQLHQHTHLDHQQHGHMMPLINGLEPNGVIIQDINLASATWSSPEDLYSI